MFNINRLQYISIKIGIVEKLEFETRLFRPVRKNSPKTRASRGFSYFRVVRQCPATLPAEPRANPCFPELLRKIWLVL
jgi:hypothetical protein